MQSGRHATVRVRRWRRQVRLPTGLLRLGEPAAPRAPTAIPASGDSRAVICYLEIRMVYPRAPVSRQAASAWRSEGSRRDARATRLEPGQLPHGAFPAPRLNTDCLSGSPLTEAFARRVRA